MNEDSNIRIITNVQYIKNLSLKNYMAPGLYTKKKISPNVSINVDINGNKLTETIYEVELIVIVNGLFEKEKMFDVELTYAGIFDIQNVKDDEYLKELIFVYCPSLLFPYARRIISETTSDASLPSLLLETINFKSLYDSKKDTLIKKII